MQDYEVYFKVKVDNKEALRETRYILGVDME